MSALVVGLSHRSAPMSLLEQAALGDEGVEGLGAGLTAGEHIAEALVLSTCNRLEVVVEAETFHGALAEIGDALCAATGISRDELMPHLYVHYDERAVSHLFSLASGLDSMAVGESQILGQLRDALAVAQGQGRLGPTLNPLVQHALRVGKRAHAETTIDQVSRSLVTMGLDHAAGIVPDLTRGAGRAVVVGAGAMCALVVATLARAGHRDVTVVNRTRATADRLAATHGYRAADWAELSSLLGGADLVISATGAVGRVVEVQTLREARETAGRSGTPLAILDLALPRDVDLDVETLEGVQLWGLGELGHEAEAADQDRDTESAVEAVRGIVDDEVADYLTQRRASTLGPSLAALRAQADSVVQAELARLEQRLPHLEGRDRDEIRQAVRRAVDKVLHTPVVRAKQLAAASRPEDYGQAFRELFDLDPYDVVAVTSVPESGPHSGPDQGHLP